MNYINTKIHWKKNQYWFTKDDERETNSWHLGSCIIKHIHSNATEELHKEKMTIYSKKWNYIFIE